MPKLKLVEFRDHLDKLDFEYSFIGMIEGNHCDTFPALFDEFSKVLLFPKYFGNNMDALYDCLLDLSWIEEQDILLIINRFDEILKSEIALHPDAKTELLLLLDQVCASETLCNLEDPDAKIINVAIVESCEAENILLDNSIPFERI
ncbi:MAG: barstar family protein [Saprospiraceae bacterium]|nr:barstar family protein [Saprospiraceae bacterium]MCC6843543.1 barstar family protein [Saprospiraceae bacterium]HRG31735.1 barstar family protein [Saprospiraceae bacterium]